MTSRPVAIEPTDFRTAFCREARCADAAFERTLFRSGLYRHARPLAWLIQRLSPRFFREDLDFIRWVGCARSLREVMDGIEQFQYTNRVCAHWPRTGLRLHLDPGRLRRLALNSMSA